MLKPKTLQERIAIHEKALDLALDDADVAMERKDYRKAVNCIADAAKYGSIITALRMRDKDYEV